MPFRCAVRTARTVISSHATWPVGFFDEETSRSSWKTASRWGLLVSRLQSRRPQCRSRPQPKSIWGRSARVRDRPNRALMAAFGGRGMAHSWACVAPKCHSQKFWNSVFSLVSSSGGGLPGRPRLERVRPPVKFSPAFFPRSRNPFCAGDKNPLSACATGTLTERIDGAGEVRTSQPRMKRPCGAGTRKSAKGISSLKS